MNTPILEQKEIKIENLKEIIKEREIRETLSVLTLLSIVNIALSIILLISVPLILL